MATLLSAVTSDGAGSGASHTGPCTVMVHGDSVYDGASIQIQVADSDTTSDYSSIMFDGFKRFEVGSQQSIFVNANSGSTYFLRAVVSGAGGSTSLNVVTV